jgi:hypothetical protein
VWTFAIALDLAVNLGLDLGKFFFDFDKQSRTKSRRPEWTPSP